MKVWYTIAVISSLLSQKTAYGIVCLRCDGVPQPRFCNQVVECYDNELCGVEKVTNNFGEHVFNLGCLSKKVCSNFTLGQHLSSSQTCGECCGTTDLCNSKGCGEPGYPSERGPVCYNCPIYTEGGRCHDIEFCSDTEVCSIVGKPRFSSVMYTSKCVSKHDCKTANETHVAIIGKRDMVHSKRTHELHVCDTCCGSDLCNRDCNSVLMIIDHCNPNPCVNGHCETKGGNFVCTCIPGFSGIRCDFATARDCSDLYHKFDVRDDGIFNITTWNSHENVQVFCDMTTAGGGWTVFQNRFDGSLNFQKSFNQYESGFGNLHGEFWLGLKYIHEMTSQRQSELRIDLTTPGGKTAFENFQNFSVSAGPNYTLHILRGTGTAGDSDDGGLSYHNNMHFSTFDHDNDRSHYNCAAASSNPGGWWFYSCFNADLNGNNLTFSYSDFARVLKASKMMFRKV
ncbi:uncharacterized protein LOC123548492 [Mercenaria mercenaria]|uniref:uncharacterized protein LOC123548492 n=1 Tax=Mercenaria mercenaria TaxID=6596 RepID=UPI00234E4A18|nr:uncharacterized protein LOC123548492 [Mercenaria mercenaria]